MIQNDADELLKLPTMPAPPEFSPDLKARIDAIETLAAKLAATADDLKNEISGVSKNLTSIVAYLREVSEWRGEMNAWRENAEKRIQELERRK